MYLRDLNRHNEKNRLRGGPGRGLKGDKKSALLLERAGAVSTD